MEMFKLLVIFAVLVALILIKKPLTWAILAAALTACLLFKITPPEIVKIAIYTVTSTSTISMVVVMYLVTLLQKMMQTRGHIDLAQESLSALCKSRLVNASVAPIFLGLLPTAGSVFIAGDLVEASVGSNLSTEEKAAATSFFRHIPEAFMPTYPAILLALSISGVAAYQFVLGMLIPALALFIIGFFVFLRKVPRDESLASAGNKATHAKNLFISMWSITLIIILILAFQIDVYIACAVVLIIYCILNKFKPAELFPLIIQAFEKNIMLNIVLLMFFKDILTETGIINSLPKIFATLPIPTYVIFTLIFFFGTIVSGSQAIVAVCMPLAYSAIPDGGVALLVLLMCASYAAMQVSPTHVCLALVAEYFHTNMGTLIRKTIPTIVAFMVFVPIYCAVLWFLGI